MNIIDTYLEQLTLNERALVGDVAKAKARLAAYRKALLTSPAKAVKKVEANPMSKSMKKRISQRGGIAHAKSMATKAKDAAILKSLKYSPA